MDIILNWSRSQSALNVHRRPRFECSILNSVGTCQWRKNKIHFYWKLPLRAPTDTAKPICIKGFPRLWFHHWMIFKWISLYFCCQTIKYALRHCSYFRMIIKWNSNTYNIKRSFYVTSLIIWSNCVTHSMGWCYKRIGWGYFSITSFYTQVCRLTVSSKSPNCVYIAWLQTCF